MRRDLRRRDERGEALPVAILFLGVFVTILIGVHVVIVAMARTAVQSAADAAIAGAQAAGPGPQECDGDLTTMETARECEGILGCAAGHRVASDSSIVETRPPAIVVESEKGIRHGSRVRGDHLSRCWAGSELTAQACGPLDNVPASELTSTDIWQC